MGTGFSRYRYLAIPLALSMLTHGIGASLLPSFSHIPAADPVETISFTKARRIQIEHRETPATRRARANLKVAMQPHAQTTPWPPVHLTKDAKATPAPVALAQAQVAAPVAAIARNAATTVPYPPGPTPQATASTDSNQVVAKKREVAGGYMPFGADDPTPVLEPTARVKLENMNVHVTLVIVVSDDGHTKSVRFDPPIGKALESQIQTMLASANWDPAYCGGGIPCESTATIKL